MARLNILKLRAVAPEPPVREPEPVYIAPPETLCRDCVFSQIVEGHVDEHELILCGFDGQLRSVLFPVARCTDYRERAQRGGIGVGFGASL